MNPSEKDPWVIYLEHDVLWAEGPGVLRVKELVIKVRHTGLLAVVKARRDGEHLVGFVGAGNLQSLAGKVRKIIAGSGTAWRHDKFYKLAQK